MRHFHLKYKKNFLGRGIANLLPKISLKTRPVSGPRTFQNVDTPVGVSAGSALPEIWLPPSRHCRLAMCLAVATRVSTTSLALKVILLLDICRPDVSH